MKTTCMMLVDPKFDLHPTAVTRIYALQDEIEGHIQRVLGVRKAHLTYSRVCVCVGG